MSTPKYAEKYRIASARAPHKDYGALGTYFITINTKKREPFFGQIDDEEMHLSPVGVIVDLCWHELNRRFSDWYFDAYVVMPDHFHGILIKKQRDARETYEISTEQEMHNLNGDNHIRFRNPGKNTLSSVVGSFKSSVTRHARRLGYDFAWQTRFHDIIAKDDQALHNFRHYIKNNIKNWEDTSKDKA